MTCFPGCIDLTASVEDDFVDLTSSQRDGANDSSVVVSCSLFMP